MTKFWFIRHGESTSNAGLPSDSDELTPLTIKGEMQAQYVAEYIETAPDKFVVSPYIRTLLTGKPTFRKFPNISIETWQIQEYSYLSHEQYQGTTNRQRGNLSRHYFQTADPTIILGEGAESFQQFLERIDQCVETLASLEDEFVILFGHGWFIRALLWLLYEKKTSNSEKKAFLEHLTKIMPSSSFLVWVFQKFGERYLKKRMYRFLLFSAIIRIPNCGIVKGLVDKNREVEVLDFTIEHLPDDLRGTSLINR